MPKTSQNPGRGRRIAIVEADDAIRNSLKFALEAEGYCVSAFPAAAGLIAIPDATAAEAFILDHNLPDMTGLELLTRLRAAHASGPALFLAGRPPSALRGAAASMNAMILDKPLSGDTLSVGPEGFVRNRRGKQRSA